MVRYHCLRSFIASSIIVSVIIVSQLFLFDQSTTDTESFWRENIIITNAEDKWNRGRAIESFSLICANCSFTNGSVLNRTTDNNTMHMHDTFYHRLREHIRGLNQAPVVRNLDKFDLQGGNCGSLVIAVQVNSCSFYASIIQ